MLQRLLAVAFVLASVGVHADDVQTLDTFDKKIGYSFGSVFGQRLAGDLPDIDLDAFLQGIKDGYLGNEPLLSEQQVGELMREYQEQQRAAQLAQFEQLAQKNQELGQVFLAENQAKDGVKTTRSGLQYKVVEAGEGASPTLESQVTVHYTGSLIDGTVFDSSVQRGEPATFPVSGVIPGWTEALQLMKPGAKWQLFIPADLAYGPGGNRNIGPNETLLFDVELISVQ